MGNERSSRNLLACNYLGVSRAFVPFQHFCACRASRRSSAGLYQPLWLSRYVCYHFIRAPARTLEARYIRHQVVAAHENAMMRAARRASGGVDVARGGDLNSTAVTTAHRSCDPEDQTTWGQGIYLDGFICTASTSLDQSDFYIRLHSPYNYRHPSSNGSNVRTSKWAGSEISTSPRPPAGKHGGSQSRCTYHGECSVPASSLLNDGTS